MMRVKIKINNEDHETLSLEEGKRYLFGRRRDCDVVLQNFPGLSRTHFCLDLTKKPYSLEVIGEAQPLLLNGDEIKSHELKSTEIFLLEPYTFILELEGHTAVTRSANLTFRDGDSHFEDITQAQFEVKLVPYLTFKSLPEERSVKLRGAHWIIGRDEACDISVDNSRVSRQQCELFCKENRYYIRDLNSAHGTYASGQKVSSTTPQEIHSGDLIDIEGFNLLFELRDPTFEKNSDLFSSGANSPLKYLTPPAWLRQRLKSGSGPEDSVVVFEDRPRGSWGKKQKQQLAVVLSALVLVYIFTGSSPKDDSRTPSSAESSENEFDRLTPEQRNTVEYSFRLADNLIKQQKFELALQQLKNVHDLVDEYENSKELEAVALQYREIRDQQNYLERQRRQQAEVNQRVRDTLVECEAVAQRANTLAEIEACLQPAQLLNPTHPDHGRLIGIVQERVEERERKRAERARHQGLVSAGVRLYETAKKLEGNGDYLGAISAYQKHMRTGNPDPRNLKSKSRAAISSLEKKLSAEKEALMAEARELAGKGDHSRGIASAQKAKSFSPDDPDIATFLDDQKRELTRKLKSIYTESVLEERFGNIDAAKTKWQSILEMDVPDGEYRSRAQSKLKQYGGR